MAITVSAEALSLDEVVRVARNGETVSLSEDVRGKLAATRAFIEAQWMTDDAPLVYSFNTGVGVFKSQRVAIEDIQQFQTNLILAHATGIGEVLPPDTVRAVMLLRLKAFTSDHSAVSLSVTDRLVAFLNAGLCPVIPAQGSVGASGDLAPLAHMSGALCGLDEAEILYDGERLPAPIAIGRAGLAPAMEMQAKDASALINGSTVSLAIAALALVDALMVAKTADLSLALSLEAMRCERDAFLPELHAARPHPGQQLVARNVMRLTAGSKRMTEAARTVRFPSETGDTPKPQRVQDAYSLRCAPQVHGPVREALAYVQGIVEREINSATDNPLIVEVDGTRRAVSGGHFHGQYLAQAMDLLAIALADLGSICERRIARLIDPGMSDGLPRNLASGKPGLNTGYGTVQCSMSALVMESRSLAAPGSTDSVPGKGNAEDHVSNSAWCARKAQSVVRNTRMIAATEAMVAGQALSIVADLAGDHPLAPATGAMLDCIRTVVPVRDEGDVWFARDMAEIERIVADRILLAACESVIGALE